MQAVGVTAVRVTSRTMVINVGKSVVTIPLQQELPMEVALFTVRGALVAKVSLLHGRTTAQFRQGIVPGIYLIKLRTTAGWITRSVTF